MDHDLRANATISGGPSGAIPCPARGVTRGTARCIEELCEHYFPNSDLMLPQLEGLTAVCSQSFSMRFVAM
jgi:hypothetical protein